MRHARRTALLALLLLLPAAAEAQRSRGSRYDYESRRRDTWPERQLTLAVGVLNYDYAGDDYFPMAALRLDWRLSRHVRSELSFAYALAEVATADPESTEEENSSLLAATLGIQAELPTPVIRPYIGAAAGLFGRFDSEDGGASFVRPTHAFPVGIRIALSPRVGIRGEVRFRFDEHKGAETAENVEQTVGLSITF